VVSVAIAMDGRGELAGDPVVDVMGLPAKTRRGDSIPDLVADTVMRTLDNLPKPSAGSRRASRTRWTGRSAAR
jgi:ribonuclease J